MPKMLLELSDLGSHARAVAEAAQSLNQALHEGTAEALEAAVDRLKDVRLLHGMAVSPQTDVGLRDLS